MTSRDAFGALPAQAAVWLADEAIFRRTVQGQRELVSESHRLTPAERRFLALVTGHTHLRVLLDLAPHVAGISQAIGQLIALGLIEWVESPGDTVSERPRALSK